MRLGKKVRVVGLKIMVMIVITMTLFTLVVMGLWNWLVPQLFGGKPLGFLQAAGLLVLARILFGGFRGFRGGRNLHWRHRLIDRWEKMTPEERERFRAGLRDRCGYADPPPPAEPAV